MSINTTKRPAGRRRKELRSMFVYGKKCHYCKEKRAKTLDHIVPRSKGGGNGNCNIVGSCLNCNSNKFNFDYDLFVRYIEMYGVPEKRWFLSTNKYKIHQMFHYTKNTVSKNSCDRKWLNTILKNCKKLEKPRQKRIINSILKKLEK